MEYKGKTYNNLYELKARLPKLAQELLEVFGEGDWVDNEIEVYPTIKDFAKYELTDGWYVNFRFANYNGAPDPFEFIDVKAFGNELVKTMDKGTYYLLKHKKVVVTSWGW